MKTRINSNAFKYVAMALGCLSTLLSYSARSELLLPSSPLGVSTSAKPMTLITAGKDHKLFFEAYNDASDINGDGALDIGFIPNITYYGLFDSKVCYSYSTDNKLFSPSSTATGTNYKCTNAWSGNWLNYITTSRIDALRKVLYGGYREVDSATQTILRRAYIPQDAHSWAKEYTSEAINGYKISEYTTLNQPTAGKRHFFGNLTANQATNCSTLNTCSSLPPLLSVVENSSKRVWEWASKESPVLDGEHGGTRTDRSVRVEVCTSSFHDGCKQYPDGNYKPVGLLHDYGENETMLFGLLTGSYNKNMSGGVLRKVVSSFKSEVNTSNGVFTASKTIVDTFDKLRIRDYNNGSTGHTYRKGSLRTRIMDEGEYVDWGNPIAEMMYEGVRYFAGKAEATSTYSTTGSHDAAVGLTAATWDNPYQNTSSAKADWCAKPNMLVVSDVNPSYDSDQLPGSSFNSSFTGDISGLDVTNVANSISSFETGVSGLHFIGQSDLSNYDGAPTAKTVTSLALLRGLAPEEPTKQGGYYSASVAHFAKINDINSTASAPGSQTIDSFYVALASPLPKIEMPMGNNKVITLVPFAKTVDGIDGGTNDTNRAKGQYQATDQIVDFYVEEIANTNADNIDTTVNEGRAYAKFQINYEADEQGNDYDMDVVAQYIVQKEDSGSLTVKVKVNYQSTGSNQNVGYVISGSNRDGVYLVAQDKNEELPYFLNVPPNLIPGDCDVTTPPNACKKLPYLGATAPGNESVRSFSVGTGTTATVLDGPLWYAAKWGGFVDSNDNDRPDLRREWDADDNGTPDNYFLVQNPLKLKETLKRTLDNIIERTASAGNVTSNSTAITTETQVFQSLFNTSSWSGNMLSYPVDSLTGVGSESSWEANEHLPGFTSNAGDTRNIITYSGGSAVEFKWSDLSSDDKTALDDNEEILNYLRGDRRKELQNNGSFRNRTTHVLGDIVHSSPFYVKDTDTIYVGANDGMLHAFNADNGNELFAYVPSQALSRLKNLSQVDYGSTSNPHQYFVDGDIAVTSLAQTPGHNYLVSTLGQGGKGLFALDVTSPTTFGTDSFLWEYLSTTDDDLGYMLGRPTLAKMNDGSMYVIAGNGYNSNDGKAVLYLFNLTTGTLLKIDTLVAGDNGLASPGVFDSDNDGDIDFIYAGDLKGNVWKFNVSQSNSDQWDVAFKSGSTPLPFFTAKDPSGAVQPITAQITVAKNFVATDSNVNKRFIIFGTGSYFMTNDPNDLQVQTWYGLIDEGSQITSIRDDTTHDYNNLKKRTVVEEGTLTSRPVRAFSKAESNDMSGKNGWYIDLTKANGAAEGERIVTSSKVYNFAEPTLLASSIIPVVDPCVPGGKGYVNAINPFTGARLGLGFFDVNGNGIFTDDKINDENNNLVSSIDLSVGMPSEPVVVGDRLVVGGSSGQIKDIKINLGITPNKGRISWREILQD